MLVLQVWVAKLGLSTYLRRKPESKQEAFPIILKSVFFSAGKLSPIYSVSLEASTHKQQAWAILRFRGEEKLKGIKAESLPRASV